MPAGVVTMNSRVHCREEGSGKDYHLTLVYPQDARQEGTVSVLRIGTTSPVARLISDKLGEALGRPVIEDNRPGGNTIIGTDAVAKAPPDGYTLFYGYAGTWAINTALNPKLPYDAFSDFTPVAHVGNAPSIMLVPNSSPAHTVKEWIAYAKSRPGKLNYASSGNGTIVQLTAELFKAQAVINSLLA
mgnify:CR=1 FL=1